ncbi:MAG: flagellar hook-length control protein FliK, partial [Nitrospinota bacterium]
LLRLLARAGEPGGRLELPAQGPLRLAPGEGIPAPLRMLLAKGPLAGEVLPFESRAAAGVNLAGTVLRFQLDPLTQPGDKLIVRPQEVGGSLALQVLVRGGPRASVPPAGVGLLSVLRASPARPAPAISPQQALQPGNLLEGILLRLQPEGPGPGAALFHGKPEGPPQASPPGRAAAPAPSAGENPARTGVIRFQGFEMEVPWPEEASGAFVPGDPVRVWVRGTGPRLELELLPPALRGEGSSRWVPSAGAGERSFGPGLLALAEGLAELAKGSSEDSPEEAAFSREGARLHAALERLTVRDGELTPERVREALEAARREFDPGRARSPEEAASLRESLQRFIAAARELGRGSEPLFAGLGPGAGRALTSMEFLNAANALRQHTGEGSFLQIPYVLGGERGTMDVVIRDHEREAPGQGRKRETYSAVVLLELEGLGPLRVDAALMRDRASVRFTPPSEPVGRFLSAELPKLREAIESQEIGVERLSWLLGKVAPEPPLPAPPEREGPEGASPLIDVKV